MNRMLLSLFTLLVLATALIGCTVVSTSTSPADSATPPESAPAADGAEVADALQAEALAGRWMSREIEFVEPEGPFGLWDFTLTEETWALLFSTYADAEGSVKLFDYRIAPSRYTIVGPAAEMEGAEMEGAEMEDVYEADFDVTGRFMTAHAPDFVALFNENSCGAAEWEIGVEQEVTETGCVFIPSSSECPVEHDLVSLTDGLLTLGERTEDMCDTVRPANLSTHSFERVDETD